MEDVGRYSTDNKQVRPQQAQHGLSGRILTGSKLHRVLPCAALLHLSGLDSFGTDPKRLTRPTLIFLLHSLFVAASTVTSAGQNWQLGGGSWLLICLQLFR